MGLLVKGFLEMTPWLGSLTQSPIAKGIPPDRIYWPPFLLDTRIACDRIAALAAGLPHDKGAGLSRAALLLGQSAERVERSFPQWGNLRHAHELLHGWLPRQLRPLQAELDRFLNIYHNFCLAIESTPWGRPDKIRLFLARMEGVAGKGLPVVLMALVAGAITLRGNTV